MAINSWLVKNNALVAGGTASDNFLLQLHHARCEYFKVQQLLCLST